MAGEASTANEALVFNIQRFSVHDGPGIRDLVFFKGCPLRCRWCSNPESQHPLPEIAFKLDRCIGSDACGRCIPACPTDAIRIDRGKVRIDRRRCTRCGQCVGACDSGALTLFGKAMSVDDVVRVIEEDSVFYGRSGGGVTVSGGEPCQQAPFVEALLHECQERGIATSVETTGYARWRDVERVCRYADLVLYDVKCMDSTKHKAFTGVPNMLILENLRNLAGAFADTPIVVRTPIVPGFNDMADDIEAIVHFLQGIATVRSYELLAYHRFGEPKYRQLNRRYPLRGETSPSEERMRELRAIADRVGEPADVPSDDPSPSTAEAGTDAGRSAA
ncbi:MAG: glycyl-radical enzyme activating protein [Burkholderiales bacterium]|nr:glycyl-radical enzyme activating protein [Burkholderiales bacterium]